jgi:23S rRNA (cytosine1962-C5)-methyltransferase
MNSIRLIKGKEKAILHHHPWIFSGAVDNVTGTPVNGETIEVFSSTNQFLGVAAYSPFSQIRARMWSFENETINLDFFIKRIKLALSRREIFRRHSNDNAWRLVHAESDLLPGLIVDQFNDVLVIQILSSGAEYNRELILQALILETEISNAYERSDAEVRKLEGLNPRLEVLAGEVPDEAIINEDRHQFIVALKTSQKTGFFLDQRFNRKIASLFCKEKDVLDAFTFSGGFSIYAHSAGAKSVCLLDSSADAIALAKRNFDLNGYPVDRSEWITDDAFTALRKMRDQNRSFDTVILDPPKFAPTASQVDRAARGYKDINLLAFKLLRPGGTLITFSCSGGVSEALFQKIVADAALDAKTHATILQRLSQGPDHPVGLNFPEGAYLKGLICKRD